MNRSMMFPIGGLAVAITMSCGGRSSTQSHKTLGQQECAAIKLAQEYVAKNGYTVSELPHGSEITPELQDELLPRAEVLRLRRGTLNGNAYGLSEDATGDPSKRLVLFTFAPRDPIDKPSAQAREWRELSHDLAGLCRAVEVDLKTGVATIRHKDFALASVQIVLAPHSGVPLECGTRTFE